MRELEILRKQWLEQYSHPESIDQTKELSKEVMQRVEKWLDQGMGTCRLRLENAWSQVVNAMHYFDGDRYELGCYVVMPNHVHVVVRPQQSELHPLEKILQSWKRHTSREIQRLDETHPSCVTWSDRKNTPFWQPESFDRIIRDEEHLYRVIQYIGRNPKIANLSRDQYCLWIRPQWEALGYGFENDE